MNPADFCFETFHNNNCFISSNTAFNARSLLAFIFGINQTSLNYLFIVLSSLLLKIMPSGPKNGLQKKQTFYKSDVHAISTTCWSIPKRVLPIFLQLP